MVSAAVVCALLVLGYAATSGVLSRAHVSAPLAFLLAGGLLGFFAGAPTAVEVVWIKAVVSSTLALILFHDAARVQAQELRAIRGLVVRLLLLGLPLAVGFHFLATRWIIPEQPVLLSLFVAVALVPTDAASSSAILLDTRLPVRVRALLNVEGGLSDGLVTPVALFAIAVLAGSGSVRPAVTVLLAAGQLALGCTVGAAAGVVGAFALGWSRQHAASTRSARALGLMSIPILGFGGAELVGGNGFVAAFAAGLAFSVTAHWMREEEGDVFAVSDAAADLLGFGVWLVFGLVAVPQLWFAARWRDLLLAVLSLTVLRMLPTALSLVGSGLRRPTILFLGWSGPRGLATVVFTLLALESLTVDDVLREALLAVSLTVLLSMLAHGLFAAPVARRFGTWVQSAQPPVETGSAPEPRPRGTLVRRRRP